MSVPKGRRNQSRFEARHHFFQLRDAVTELILNDFGFSQEKNLAKMEKYRENHKDAANVDEVVQRWETKNDSFVRWFIDSEAKEILDLLRDIERNFTLGNSIYPSDSPAKIFEFVERRKYMDRAIGLCYTLKQEINYVLRTLPVDFNKFERFSVAIDEQIALYKGVRQADNRLLKKKGEKMPEWFDEKTTNVFDVIAAVMREIGKSTEEEEAE